MEEERGAGGVKLEVTPLMPCQENFNNLARQLSSGGHPRQPWLIIQHFQYIFLSMAMITSASFIRSSLGFCIVLQIIRAIGLSQDRSSVGN
jgi:hypothetical protein